ncbi:hypothetical protein E6H37_06035 [Candidatus Bathyarchaeota archaeon]|nr:MAG: hypothetical protein E6H37_06035 [Candidatus Bathyarchaeota archaeon]
MTRVYKSQAPNATTPTTVRPTVNKISAGSKITKSVPTSQNRAPLCILIRFLAVVSFRTPIR